MNLLKKTILALIMLAFLTSGSGWFHEFYVSLTEIRYNPDSQRMEVSLRIFPDDMDRELEKVTGITPHLVTELETHGADSLVRNYLYAHFQLYINGEEVNLSFLGKEAEADVMWCYLESEPVGTPLEIFVRNSILTEMFEDQVNIIQTYVGDWNRGLLLNRENPDDHLTVGE